MTEPLIIVNDLSYRPAGPSSPRILHRVNLEIRTGERIAIIGANGSGKTTFLKLMSGWRTPQCQVEGDISTSEILAQRRGAIGYVRQRSALFPWLNVRQNVGFSAALNESPIAGEDRRLDEHLADFGCASLARRHPAQLSGGETQRVALAQSLFSCPSLLLLDEPFSAMDVSVKTAMVNKLRELWREHGFAVILVSHDFRDVLRLADRIYVLSYGEKGSTISRKVFEVDDSKRSDTSFIKDMLWAMSEATNYKLISK